MAKRKSLFDDKPVEIQELTYIIKEDINSLNKQIAQLQEVAKIHSGQNGRQKQSHSNSVVVALQVHSDFVSVRYRKDPKIFGSKKLCRNLPKIHTKRPNGNVFCQKHAKGIVNREDPDQNAPRGAV